MPKKNKDGKTAEEVKLISERLYNSGTVKTQPELPKGVVLGRKDVDDIVERLFQKNPHEKKEELAEKANTAREKERPESMGWQKISKEYEEGLTSRLFVPDYNNRHVPAAVSSQSDSTVSKSELEEIVGRLFVSDYSNKNIVNNKTFYDQILTKKKTNEKEMTKEEYDKVPGRLTREGFEPAECNKEMRGQQNYKATGIYGTYLLNNAITLE